MKRNCIEHGQLVSNLTQAQDVEMKVSYLVINDVLQLLKVPLGPLPQYPRLHYEHIHTAISNGRKQNATHEEKQYLSLLVKALENKAAEYYQTAAAQGDADAQMNLGICFEYGTGVEKDEKKAVEWYEKAAAQGHAYAQNKLGVCFEEGIGVEQDDKKAFEWYEKSAEQGHATAQTNLGNCFQYGTGVEKDEKKAVEWYEKAAVRGYAFAQTNLGYCFEKGTGIEKDKKKAFEWYEKAAAQGHAYAQNKLGVCFEEGIGVEQDDKKAFEWYEKSAEQGHAVALYNLGLCFHNGIGVEKDETKAFELIKRAATKGDLYSQHWVDNWTNQKIANDANVIIKQIEASEDCYIPDNFPIAVTQFGPYCGSAAFASAVNYSGCLPYPIYASSYEKKAAGEDINKTDDIVLSQLKHTPYPSDGPQYSIHSFQALAQRLNIKGEAVLKENYTEEEYTKALCDSFKANNVLILPCDEEYEMPANNQGNSTHWALGLAYWRGVDDKYYVLASHHGYYCVWSMHDLYESNKQLPQVNPREQNGHLKEYRFSFYKVPVKKPREIMTSIKQQDSINLNSSIQKKIGSH